MPTPLYATIAGLIIVTALSYLLLAAMQVLADARLAFWRWRRNVNCARVAQKRHRATGATKVVR